MILILTVTVWLAWASTGAGPETAVRTADTGLAEELAAVEQAIVRAWVARDEKTVDRILADDWTVIDMTGRILTKAEVMREGFGSQERRIESGSIDDLRVRALGNVAVVTGRSVLTGTYRGSRVTVTQRFTDVFARRSGRWQVVASQGTRVSAMEPDQSGETR